MFVFFRFLCAGFAILFLCVLGCGTDDDVDTSTDVLTEDSLLLDDLATDALVDTPEESGEAMMPNTDQVADDADEDDDGFTADFSLTLGSGLTGSEYAEEWLPERQVLVSKWSERLLTDPSFPIMERETAVGVVVLSLLDMGFLENELVTLQKILEKGEDLGLLPCPAEVAPHLRGVFLDQPDYRTGDRLGEFFVAMQPLYLVDMEPRIFSVVRDDDFPHEETELGLWLIANKISDAGRDRRFDPLDPENKDHGGRFAFMLPLAPLSVE